MPIVLSYNDVEALGSLSFGAGQMAGEAQRGRQDLGMLVQHEQHAQRLAMQAQQREADRDLRRELLGEQQAFQQQQAQQQMHQAQQDRQAAMADAEQQRQARLAQELLQQRGRMARDALQHEQRLERDVHQAGLGRWRGADAGQAEAFLGRGGMPDRGRVRQEMQQFGHLIPFEPDFAATDVASRSDRVRDDAEALTALPTPQLQELIQQRPDDPWVPYLEAVVEARGGVVPQRGARRAHPPGADAGGLGGVPRGGNPEAGRRMPQQPGMAPPRPPQSRAGAGAAGDPLANLTNEQLRQIADNPELLHQLGGAAQPPQQPQRPPMMPHERQEWRPGAGPGNWGVGAGRMGGP